MYSKIKLIIHICFFVNMHLVSMSGQVNCGILIDSIVSKCYSNIYIVPKEVPYKTTKYQNNIKYDYFDIDDYYSESIFYFDKFKNIEYAQLLISKNIIINEFICKLRNKQYINNVFIYDFLFTIQNCNKIDYLELLELLLINVEDNKLNQDILIAAIDQKFYNNYYSNFVIKNSNKSKYKKFLIRTILSASISKSNKEYLAKYFDHNWIAVQNRERVIKKININNLQNEW